MKKRAFTTVEVLFTLALLLLLLGFSMASLRGSADRSQVQGAAETVAETLRNARMRAMFLQVPVGFALPGGRPNASGFYVLEGAANPRITRNRDLTGEYPQAQLTFPFTSGDTAPGAFDFGAWEPPTPADPTLVFTPDGKVHSNGVPLRDGAYWICLGRAFMFGEPQSVRAIQLFPLLSAAGLVSVGVNPLGQVTVQNGLPGLPVPEAQTGVPQGPAPPQVAGPPSEAPVIEKVEVFPDPSELNVPTGFQALLNRDEYLTLRVVAKSRGVPLFCSWTRDGGAFTHPPGDARPMQWEAASKSWVSLWQWKPDPLPSTQTEYRLECKVSDAWGNQAALEGLARIRLKVTDSLPVMLGKGESSDPAGKSHNVLYTAHADGTTVRKITDPEKHRDVSAGVSPDGNLVFSIIDSGGTYKLALKSIEGDVLTEFTDPEPLEVNSPPVWSPDGTHVAYVAGGDIVIRRPDGSLRRKPRPSPETETFTLPETFFHSYPTMPRSRDDLVWSPAGDKLMFYRFTPGPSAVPELCVMSESGGAVTVLATGTRDGMGRPALENACWDPNPANDRLAYSDGNSVHIVKGGSDTVAVSGRAANVHFSPDGTRLCYTTGILHPLFVVDTPASGAVGAPVQVSMGGGDADKTFGPVWADNERISFTRGGANTGRAVVVNVTSGERSVVVRGMDDRSMNIYGWSVP